MALAFQKASIDITNGVDTKTDAKLVVSSKLLTLEDGVFVKGGSIKKRFGYKKMSDALVSGGNQLAGDALAVYAPSENEEELLKILDGQVFSYSEALGQLVPKGLLPQTILSTKQITNNTADQTESDSVIYKDIGLYVWTDSRDGVRASVVDEKTGSFIIGDVLLRAGASKPKCVRVGNSLVAFYSSGLNLYARPIDLFALTGFGTELLIGVDFGGQIDACDFNDSVALICYYASSANVKVSYVLPNGALGSVLSGLPNPSLTADDASASINIIPNSARTKIYVAYGTSASSLRQFSLNADFTSDVAPHLLGSGTKSYVAVSQIYRDVDSSLNVYFTTDDVVQIFFLSWVSNVSLSGTVNSTNQISTGSLAAKAFSFNNSEYVWLIYDSKLQATYFLYRNAVGFPVVGKAFPGLAGRTQPTLPRINLYDGTYVFSGLSQNRLVSNGGVLSTQRGISDVIVDFGNDNRYNYALNSELLNFAGGVMTIYDGLSIVESGFNVYPELSYSNPTVTIMGNVQAGTYLYIACSKWVDNRGNIHRSAFCPPIKVVVSDASKVNFSIPTNHITSKKPPRSNIEIEVYRTENLGQIFYRVFHNGVANAITYNDVTVLTVPFVDNTGDSVLIGNEIAYTTGGELPNDAPYPCKYVANHKTRLFYIDDKDQVRYSKESKKGDAPGFPAEFLREIDPFGGPLTALASLDANLVGLKETSQLYLPGEGPLSTGEQNDYPNFQFINTSVGCSDPNSIVRVPDGLMFKSLKGYRILTRALEDGYIGADVEAFNGLKVTSADLLRDVNEVRFKTNDGVTLMYDYFFKQWGTFTNSQGADAVIYRNKYTYLRNNGQIYVETPGYFKDDQKTYKLKFETAWLKLSGIQNFQRVTDLEVLGDYKSPHILAVSVAYDYQGFSQKTYYFDPSDVIDVGVYGDKGPYGYGTKVYGGVTDDVYQFDISLQKQKCESIKFTFEDIYTDGTGESYSVSNLTLTIGQKQGAGKFMPVSKKI